MTQLANFKCRVASIHIVADDRNYQYNLSQTMLPICHYVSVTSTLRFICHVVTRWCECELSLTRYSATIVITHNVVLHSTGVLPRQPLPTFLLHQSRYFCYCSFSCLIFPKHVSQLKHSLSVRVCLQLPSRPSLLSSSVYKRSSWLEPLICQPSMTYGSHNPFNCREGQLKTQ